MTGMQATLTANFARSQVIHALIDPASSNCAHAFLEAVSKYLEVSRLCPVLCSDADLAITLGSFLDQLPEKFGSGLRFQIQMYKSNRESGNAADSDDNSASSTPRRLLLQSDLARALKEHDRSVRRKDKELRISTSITDLASTPAQATQLADLQRQLTVLQERLATRHAPATSSSKRPSAAPAPANPAAPVPSPRSTARALAVASTTAPKRAIARAKDIGPRMRNCAHCDGRHLDRDCASHPRASASPASGGHPTSSPPTPPRDLGPPAASAPVAPTAVAPPHTVAPPASSPTPDAKSPALTARRVTFRRVCLASSTSRPSAGSLRKPPAGSLPDPAAAQSLGPASGGLNCAPALFSGRFSSAAFLPALSLAAAHTQHHLHVDIPPLPPSTDSKQLQTRQLARLHAAVSGTTLTSVWPIRCSTSLVALATAFMQFCTALFFCATRIGAAVLCMLCRMLDHAPETSNTPLLLASPPPSPPMPSHLKRPTSPQLHPRKARRPTAYSPTESSDPNGPDWSPMHFDTGASREANSLSLPPTSPVTRRRPSSRSRRTYAVPQRHHSRATGPRTPLRRPARQPRLALDRGAARPPSWPLAPRPPVATWGRRHTRCSIFDRGHALLRPCLPEPRAPSSPSASSACPLPHLLRRRCPQPQHHVAPRSFATSGYPSAPHTASLPILLA